MTKPGDVTKELKDLLAKLKSETDSTTLSNHARKKLESEVQDVINGLSGLLDDLDPIRRPTSLFNPSNPQVVGRFVALAMVAQQRIQLADLERSYGSGVYAIYYSGKFPAYAPISGTETPIYVGKADPASRNAKTPREQGDKLSARLMEHRKNIALATTTLDLVDFQCRALAVQSGTEDTAEKYLIHLFNPIWNSETGILYGLGKHGDSAGTRQHPRSPWDTMHPGRVWAAASASDSKTVPQIDAELAVHFNKHPVFTDLNSVLESFVQELRQL